MYLSGRQSAHTRRHGVDTMRGADRSLDLRVLGAFYRTMQSYRLMMMRKFSEHGMHPGQAICLREVAHNDGVSQSDLAVRLGVKRPTITVMLQKMERSGLVYRETDSADQRITRIHLTDAGNAMHDTLHGILDEVAAQVVGPLSADDQAELERLLGRLNDNIRATLDCSHEPEDCE